MSNVMISKSDFTITVKKEGGRIFSTAPMTVKNQIRELRSIEDFDDVNVINKQDGSMFIYNSATGKYEVKLYNDDPLLNVQNLYVSSLWANGSRGSNGQVLFTNGNTIYWANGVTKINAGTGLSGGGQGDQVTLSVNAAYIATITSNNALFAYGKREGDLNVNFANFAGDANFSYTANNATYAYGKPEGTLSVQYANFAGASNTANYATLANNSMFAYGKREFDLSVNFAQFSGVANFAYAANTASTLGGVPAGNLNVNSATYATYADFALNAGLSNTGVVPGTYGNSSSIPVITVDSYGRLTNATTTAVAGVNNFTYSSSNNTFTIATGDGSTFKATIDTVRNLTVTGNLTVSGTTTTVNTQNLTVKDPVIRLNDGQITPLNDIGLILQRYANATSANYNVAVAWDEVYKQFKIGAAPEDGSDTEISFSQEWLRIDEDGNLYMLLNIEAGNYVKAGSYMIINNVSFNEKSYPGTANAALYFDGIIDCGTY